MRKQAEDQEATLLAQEEEVHGKQRELDALKEEEKKLLEDIKNSEKEIQKLSHDLEVATEINSEVSNSSILTRKLQLLESLIFYGNSQRLFSSNSNILTRKITTFEIIDFLREFATFVLIGVTQVF